MTQNVRLQNLRDFTVQIRNADNQIVGTGIAVSTDGKIVTCAHVVEAALGGTHPRNANGAEVGVYFPQARGGEENRRATVEKYFNDYDDDVVLLQLTDGASPLAPEQIAVLGTAEESQDNLFRSYGYRNLQEYSAGWADGTINGSIERPPNRKLQSDPVQITSSQINGGMSGSAVLDKDRNLIVGIISETWIPDSTTKDRDTGWAVNSRVLSLAPLELPVQDVPLPYKPAPSPKTDIAAAQAQVDIKEKFSWNNAPSVLLEWTGRDHLIEQITADWNDSSKHVTGLIGFGGEGKSSLARKWVDNLLNDPSQTQPNGIFWWGFYENRSVDEFLEAALKYMSGGKIDPRQIQSSNKRAQILGAMLSAGRHRYLFVLDGLEVVQYQEGDQYGLLQSNDLRDLLTFFARPDNQSFCLITSRAPLLDLMDYTTYTHRDVDRLSADDGRALLQRLGVKGSDAELNKVVADWDGHALILSILAVYLAERFEGDIKHLADIPVPTADEPRYERVHRVLRRYDEYLTKDEREFLKLFSLFRLPVQESAFEKVFEQLLKSLDKNALLKLVSRLVHYRLIRHNEQEKAYTTHPLIRSHYIALFTKSDVAQERAAHSQIKDYYLSISGDTPQYPTLDDLKPLIEVVYHACEAGAYVEAHQIRNERIDQRNRHVMANQLVAFETRLSLMSHFFPDGDWSKEPQGTDDEKRFTLNAVGACLKNLGRLREALPFFERGNAVDSKLPNWRIDSAVYRNLADLHASLGALGESAKSAHLALLLSRQAKNKGDEDKSLVWQAWVAHLRNDLSTASSAFSRAETLERELLDSYLCSLRGIQHADHLRRTNQSNYARRVTKANLQICEQNHWSDDISRSHRVLGDLDSDAGRYTSARAHYESALKIARSISKRDVLIEALLARGRFFARDPKGYENFNRHGLIGMFKKMFFAKGTKGFEKTSSLDQSFNELNEALGYCIESGYRIYEADVRVALAWAYIANGEKEKAKGSAERALQMSNEMGYHWGKVDAEEVLGAISG